MSFRKSCSESVEISRSTGAATSSSSTTHLDDRDLERLERVVERVEHAGLEVELDERERDLLRRERAGRLACLEQGLRLVRGEHRLDVQLRPRNHRRRFAHVPPPRPVLHDTHPQPHLTAASDRVNVLGGGGSVPEVADGRHRPFGSSFLNLVPCPRDGRESAWLPAPGGFPGRAPAPAEAAAWPPRRRRSRRGAARGGSGRSGPAGNAASAGRGARTRARARSLSNRETAAAVSVSGSSGASRAASSKIRRALTAACRAAGAPSRSAAAPTFVSQVRQQRELVARRAAARAPPGTARLGTKSGQPGRERRVEEVVGAHGVGRVGLEARRGLELGARRALGAGRREHDALVEADGGAGLRQRLERAASCRARPRRPRRSSPRASRTAAKIAPRVVEPAVGVEPRRAAEVARLRVVAHAEVEQERRRVDGWTSAGSSRVSGDDAEGRGDRHGARGGDDRPDAGARGHGTGRYTFESNGNVERDSDRQSA